MLYSYPIYHHSVTSANRRYSTESPHVTLAMLLDKIDLTISSEEKEARKFVHFLDDQGIMYYLHWEVSDSYSSSIYAPSFNKMTTYYAAVLDKKDAVTIKMFLGKDPKKIEENPNG